MLLSNERVAGNYHYVQHPPYLAFCLILEFTICIGGLALAVCCRVPPAFIECASRKPLWKAVLERNFENTSEARPGYYPMSGGLLSLHSHNRGVPIVAHVRRFAHV
jgi:hypothetical protein